MSGAVRNTAGGTGRATGAHEQLLATEPAYARLVTAYADDAQLRAAAAARERAEQVTT